jgi:hypothetical protein
MIGPMGSRTQPLRYTGQYNPIQAGTAYMHPTSQAVSGWKILFVIFAVILQYVTWYSWIRRHFDSFCWLLVATLSPSLSLSPGYGWTIGSTCLRPSSYSCKIWCLQHTLMALLMINMDVLQLDKSSAGVCKSLSYWFLLFKLLSPFSFLIVSSSPFVSFFTILFLLLCFVSRFYI